MNLRRFFPSTFGILGMLASWKAAFDDPVLLCACQGGAWWCDECEPAPIEGPCIAAPPGLLPAA